MTSVRWLLVRVVTVVVVALGAAVWASALMGSLGTYKSPFHGRTVAPGEPAGAPLTHRLVFVYVDGLRVDTAANAQVMPYLNELRARGASAISHSRQPSYSVPGYTTMMSGAWPEFNDGPLLNPDEAHLTFWPQDQIFAAAKRAGLKVGLADHYSAEKLIPQDVLADHFYVHGEDDADDRAAAEAAVRWLKDGSIQFIVVHFDQVDDTGHRFGPRSPLWNAAAGRVDVLLRELGNALDFSKDTIFVTSDHGHIDQGGHGGHERIVVREPWILAGAGVKPGRYRDAKMVDIAPTMAALLGAALPALGQGEVRSDMLQLTPQQDAAIAAASVQQQARWLDAYNAATGHAVVPPPGADTVRPVQRAVMHARAVLAASERLPRIVVALIIVVATAAALWFGRRGLSVWHVVGAVIYLAAFHGTYALAEGRTYSLSSVLSANDILLTGVLTAALAFALAVGVVLWRTRALRSGAMAAAAVALTSALVTMALVVLPALAGYAVNGEVITWHLPNFPLMFVTFLSLLQLVGIGAAALLSAALAALFGWRFSRAAPPR